MRGVPRARRAISAAPSSSIGVSSRRADRSTIGFSSGHVVMIQPQHQPEASAQGRADQPLPRGRADGGEFLQRNRMRARARAGADQDVQMEIFERRIEHLLHVRQQAMNFVDEEDLALLNAAEDAGQVELLLQHRARRSAGSRRPVPGR